MSDEAKEHDSPVADVHFQIPRRHAVALLFGAVPALAAATAAQAAICVDMNALPPSDKSMRESLNFKLHSADAQKQCHICAFFEAAGDGCGHCQLLSGGPVFADSVCDSWAQKG